MESIKKYVTELKLRADDDDYVYLFDPYYLEKHSSNEIEIINDFPTKYNRKIKMGRFLRSNNKVDFALGPIEKRECVLFLRGK